MPTPSASASEVFVVGVATRPKQDPFVWEGSFALASREDP
jgi:hypothetical protein